MNRLEVYHIPSRPVNTTTSTFINVLLRRVLEGLVSRGYFPTIGQCVRRTDLYRIIISLIYLLRKAHATVAPGLSGLSEQHVTIEKLYCSAIYSKNAASNAAELSAASLARLFRTLVNDVTPVAVITAVLLLVLMLVNIRYIFFSVYQHRRCCNTYTIKYLIGGGGVGVEHCSTLLGFPHCPT